MTPWLDWIAKRLRQSRAERSGARIGSEAAATAVPMVRDNKASWRTIGAAGPKGDAAEFAADRSARVFVSSTFRDMQAEREELVKQVFPQLRRLCEQRGIVWGEVDLRWGVSDEQKAEGKVLPICLAEIRNCRPYFIGLLGERYGWVPDEISDELIAREPWLAAHRHHSVTELEILHGVLNDPGMLHHAFFYFRSPEFIDSLPPEERREWEETATAQEIERYGAEEAGRRAEDRRDKLSALKRRIQSSGFPVRIYGDPRSLGEMVLADLSAIVERVFPDSAAPDPLDRDAAEHEAFALSRARVHIARANDIERLDDHARRDGPPLVVVGESGIGKSALLANWALAQRHAHPARPLVMHFIGATSASTNRDSMLRRLIGEICRHVGIEPEVPTNTDELSAAFANVLPRASERGGVVLVLDALNQLEQTDRAHDLAWLPSEIPANVRLIVSVLPGPALDEMRRRGWPTLTIEPLRADERRRLIKDYLDQYGKTLAAAQVERLTEAPQTGNPLYLRALLEELRLFGMHELLDQRIDHYLEAATPDLLYQKILSRLEADYERERPGLVGEAFALLWASRRGLAQADLLALTGGGGEPLPCAIWSPLHLAIEPSLVSRSGLIGFFHDYLRDAVRDRYLPRAEDQAEAHRRLADFFQAAPLGPRKIDELPWQLIRSRSWLRLYHLLADLTFFAAAWKADEFEVRRAWSQLEDASHLRLVEAYRGLIANPAEQPEHATLVGTLLRDTGHLAEAGALFGALYQRQSKAEDIGGVQALANLAAIKADTGDAQDAMQAFKALEPLFRQLADAKAWAHQDPQACTQSLAGGKAVLARNLSNQAAILHAQGERAESLKMLTEAERLFEEAGDLDGVVHSRGSQAVLLLEEGRTESGLAILEECEGAARRAGHPELLAHSLGARAQALAAQGERERPAALYEEARALLGQLGSQDGLARLLASEGETLGRQGRLSSARNRFKEAEELLRKIGATSMLTDVLYQQARLEWKLQQWQEAIGRFEEAYVLAMAVGRTQKAMEIQRMLEHCVAKL